MEVNLIFEATKQEELLEIATQILSTCTDSKIFTFTGDLGAGKTSFIQAFCKVLGYNQEVTSPTFSLVNEYKTLEDTLFHMDLYRLRSISEAHEIGIEEYLFSGHYCFIEWPQIIEELLDMGHYSVHIIITESFTRKIEIHKVSY